jgi:HlyD family secretion protein
VVVIVAGSSAAIAATGDDTAEPIVTSVTTGSITQTIEASGTIASSSKSTASFATGGTVAEVAVKAGQDVAKGQVLARLDTTDLQTKVDLADAAVASAEQRLEDDQNGQTSTTSGTGSGTGGTGGMSTDSAGAAPLVATESSSTPAPAPSAGTTSSAPSGGSTDSASGDQAQLITQIKAAQKAVVQAQQGVDTGQAAVDAAQQTVDAGIKQNLALRDAQTAACAAPTETPSPSPSSSDSSSPSSDTSATDADCVSAQADYAHYADTLATDMDTLDHAISQQDKAIKTLHGAISTLDGLIAKLQAQSGSTTGTTPGGRGSGQPGGTTPSTSPSRDTTQPGSTGQGGTGSTSRTGTIPSGSTGTSATTSTGEPASATQLAADQAAIDARKADLKVAEQNLAAATLKSPIAGSIASVGYSAGSSSSGSSITILGTGKQIVTIEVPISQIDQVKKGQKAQVQVDGQSTPLQGTVTKIGIVSTTSGSLTTFPVTVTLADGSRRIHAGVGADVVLTTGTASDAVLVPNSAITSIGTRHVVTVVTGSSTKTVIVTLGLIGTDASQVTGGVAAGERVQLADPGKALPASTTSSTTRIRFGEGGTFPAGGFGTFGSKGTGGGR